LYDEALLLLARRGFDLPNEIVGRDWSVSYAPNDALRRRG